jgi:hypothetical protein
MGNEGRAARMAVQAAAGALSMACPCDNIVMCAVAASSPELQQVRGQPTYSLSAAVILKSIYIAVRTRSHRPRLREQVCWMGVCVCGQGRVCGCAAGWGWQGGGGGGGAGIVAGAV